MMIYNVQVGQQLGSCGGGVTIYNWSEHTRDVVTMMPFPWMTYHGFWFLRSPIAITQVMYCTVLHFTVPTEVPILVCL